MANNKDHIHIGICDVIMLNVCCLSLLRILDQVLLLIASRICCMFVSEFASVLTQSCREGTFELQSRLENTPLISKLLS